jgi:hypothetical protein
MGSDLFHELIEFLAKCGKTAQYERLPTRWEYQSFKVGGTREFTKEEMDKAKFLLVFSTKQTARETARGPGGEMIVKRSDITKWRLGTSRQEFTMLCLDSLKREMEAEGFVGLEFKPVTVVGKSPPVEPVWEIWTQLKMPPMKNRLVNPDGTEHMPGTPGPHGLDDPFIPHLYRFDAKGIEALGNADAVFTQEIFGWNKRPEPQLFFSQRLRRWCDAKKLHADFTPIALE